MENIQKVAEMSFHGIIYLVKVSTKDGVLFIEVEQKDNGDQWKNIFTANYIEEITQKTGNFKKFDVFVKMLQSAISKTSETVYIDILTSQDLEMLKAKKQNNNSVVNTSTSKNSKRYMILTYSVEYDQVHYPLPLNFEETPDLETLKNTIKKLQLEVEALKSNRSLNINQSDGGFFMTQAGAIKSENELLKEKIRKLEGTGGLNNNSSKILGAVEHDLLLKAKADLENELENLKKDYVRDMKRMKAKLEETQAEVERLKEEVNRSKTESLEHDVLNQFSKRGLNMSKTEESEITSLKKLVVKHQKDAEKYKQEADSLKQLDQKQRTKIRQLETELESNIRKATVARSKVNALASPSYSRVKDLSAKNNGDKRSLSVPSKSYSSGLKSFDNKISPTKNKPISNQLSSSAKLAPVRNPMRSGFVGGNIRPKNSQNNLLTRNYKVESKISPSKSGFNDPYYGSNKKQNHLLSPPGRGLPSLNSKQSPSNKFGLPYNNYMSPKRLDYDNSVGNKSKATNQVSWSDEQNQNLFIMGSGSGPTAPGGSNVINIQNVMPQEFRDIFPGLKNKNCKNKSQEV